MMDSIALAKAIELQCRAREEQWRRNEDLFYLVRLKVIYASEARIRAVGKEACGAA